MTIPVWLEKIAVSGGGFVILLGPWMPMGITMPVWDEKDVPMPTYVECTAPVPVYTECVEPMPSWIKKDIH